MITAIISAYYAKQYIRRRLENLTSLEITPEIVVVAQAGSYEAEIAKEYTDIVIKTENIPTIYEAWNIAIQHATGEYITNANCDDYTYRGSLSKLAGMLDKYPGVALVYGDNFIVDGDRKIYHCRKYGDYEFLKTCCFVGPMPMWRKSLHDKYGLFADQYQVCGDYEFWLRIASHSEIICKADVIVGEYSKRPDSAEHRNPQLAQDEKNYIQSFYRPIALRDKI